jgi:hypothetical protein
MLGAYLLLREEPSLARFEVALFFLNFPWGNRYSQKISDV